MSASSPPGPLASKVNGNGRDRSLMQLLLAVRGRKTSLIQVHNNPDPDALGAAMGMRELYQRYLNLRSRIVFGGIVGRAENRTMLRLLQLEIVPASKVDFGCCDLHTLVDAQPGFGHAPLPEGRYPDVVIDHHPMRESRPPAVAYWDVARPVGATSTLVALLFLRNHVPIPGDVATALMYGIKSDTHDLSEHATDEDREAYHGLFPFADTATIAQIQNARVPKSYFAMFSRAIENAQVYDFACVSHLGRIDNPDMVAEMADFLLRCEDLRWTLVTGIYEQTLHFSLRSTDRNARAGSLARRVVGVMGSAGGHGQMAGGQVPLSDADKRTRDRVVKAVTDRFLSDVKAKRSLRRSLLAEPGDDTDTKEFDVGGIGGQP
ncbi:MAG: DHHA1 domain-containing protein [Planctomycetes bacterium]|nr:DHHA1 domain-containing protein [Planctomycetota bacterium]